MAPQKTSYGELLLNNRLIVLVALLILTLAGTFGAKNLYFDNDYRSFFGDTNPQLEAFEKLQRTYTKIDNATTKQTFLLQGFQAVCQYVGRNFFRRGEQVIKMPLFAKDHIS